ncbi:hypothetical protein [Nitrososphaera sp.]|uniref:hypothetical protein n=1 Tax=Nitrososphaera sp. TaxID=1971748 RepID=UPI00307EF814
MSSEFRCPECGKVLKPHCSLWQKDMIHKLHTIADQNTTTTILRHRPPDDSGGVRREKKEEQKPE